jgi:glyoxylase-like metal-dependent hydrolase (beta-lactamase superfamily II)
MNQSNTAEKLDQVKPKVVPFFDEDTNTFSYVVRDPYSSSCAIIDSVLDFDLASGSVDYRGAQAIIRYIEEKKLEVEWIIETHVHADHLSAAPYLKDFVGGKIAIGEYVTTVQQTFGEIFNAGDDFKRDGSQFDHLFKDGEKYRIGSLEAYAIHTPGHTPACMTHVIGNAAFVGDTLFMPDAGTARADFPGGDAATLYQSIQKILRCRGSGTGVQDYREGRAREQYPRKRENSASGFRCHARGERQDSRCATSYPALPAGEHARRASSSTGKQRTNLPEDSPGRIALNRGRLCHEDSSD